MNNKNQNHTVKCQLSNVKCRQKGFVVSIIMLFVLIIMLSIALSVSSLVLYSQKISANAIKSTQSYYAAESGIEDALLRLSNNPQMAPISYSLTINGTIADVTIPDMIGGSRAITSRGSNDDIIKDMQAVYSFDGEGVNFNFGVQVGTGGLQMNGPQTNVKGNVFSNGNITGSGTIDNDVIIAGNGNSIEDVYVSGNVLAYSCLDSADVGNLIYVTGGAHTCNVRGTTSVQSEEIPIQPLPISQSQIDTWKTEAEAGTTISGNLTLSGTQQATHGPVKITGNLTLSNSAILTVTGTVHVAGDITLSNTSKIKLDSSYGSLGGVVLADGTINMSNSSVVEGSGQSGSYVLLLSANVSDSAISLSNSVNNTTNSAIFYAGSGGITVNNSAKARELTAKKIIMNNSAVIEYESGLTNTFFSNGPSGGWKVTSWSEQ